MAFFSPAGDEVLLEGSVLKNFASLPCNETTKQCFPEPQWLRRGTQQIMSIHHELHSEVRRRVKPLSSCTVRLNTPPWIHGSSPMHPLQDHLKTGSTHPECSSIALSVRSLDFIPGKLGCPWHTHTTRSDSAGAGHVQGLQSQAALNHGRPPDGDLVWTAHARMGQNTEVQS